jgi:hypothetical protein
MSTNATKGRLSASSDQWLWATDQQDNAVFAYDLGKRHYPHVATITDGVSTPAELTVDALGTLYVVNSGNGTITEYPVGARSPSITLSGVSAPIGVAVNASGDVYVSNIGTPSSIAIYRPGATRPWKFLVHRLIQVPVQMFFDPSGTLYVIDNETGVYTIAPGASRVRRVRLKKLGEQPSAIAQDPSTGSLLEGDAAPPDGTERARIYTPGKRRPPLELAEQSSVHGVTFGMLKGRVVAFVPAYGTGEPIYLFHEHAHEAFASITNDIRGINGVAIQPEPAADPLGTR